MNTEQILLTIAAAFAICIGCQWLAWRVRLPAVIFLLAAGIICGPLLGLLDPEMLLGKLFFPFVSLSVAIILFEGSLTLKFREIAGLQKVVRNMLSFGLLATWVVTALATWLLFAVSWEIAILFGAITVVTGPTVIAPLLKAVRPTARVANVLRWEGIVIDPIGASLAVLVYEFIISGGGQQALGHTLVSFAQIVVVGAGIGAVAGYLFGCTLRNHWLPEFLQNVATLSLVFVTFVLANSVQPESGLVTVTVLGMWLGNMDGVDLEEILEFKESLSILLISLLFLVLAARLNTEALQSVGWAGLLLLLVVQFVARPLNVLISTRGSSLSLQERGLLAWIAPRGIVAAAISALFAIQLEQAGYPSAELLVPLTFAVIIGTVLFQSVTARPLAHWLGVAEPEPRGFLIIGANPVARAIARALMGNGIRVLLADTGWEKISQAKIEGLETYLGNPISEHADRTMSLVGIGRMLALSPQESVNVAAVMHYRLELGRNNVYVLQSKPREELAEMMKLPPHRRGKLLFGTEVTYAKLAHALAQGGELRTTKLSDQFSFLQFTELHGEQAQVLFMIDPKGRVRVVTVDDTARPEAGWSLVSLFREKEGGALATPEDEDKPLPEVLGVAE